MDWKQLLMMTPLYDWFGKRSYAQSGEDIIAWGELQGSIAQGIESSSNRELKESRGGVVGLLEWITSQGRNDNGNVGIYVDIGAYHPKLFSNTYLFYKKGWSGICVDPNPEIGKMFAMTRPRDIFLNVGVGEKKQKNKKSKNPKKELSGWIPGQARNDMGKYMEYFMFDDGAANTFSVEQVEKNQAVGRKLLGTKKVKTESLENILDKYLPKGEKIDLLSVDVEGMDLEVLKSNDWKKYRPRVIICEDLNFDLDGCMGGVRLSRSARNDVSLQGDSLKGVTDKLDCRPSRRVNSGLAMTGGVVGYLSGLGYKLKAMTPYSLIFKDTSI